MIAIPEWIRPQLVPPPLDSATLLDEVRRLRASELRCKGVLLNNPVVAAIVDTDVRSLLEDGRDWRELIEPGSMRSMVSASAQATPVIHTPETRLRVDYLFALVRKVPAGLRTEIARDVATIKRRRALLLAHNLRLVHYFAERTAITTEEYEDLFQAGAGPDGLLRAIDTFDPEKGSFGNHAGMWIRQSVQRQTNLLRSQFGGSSSRADISDIPIVDLDARVTEDGMGHHVIVPGSGADPYEALCRSMDEQAMVRAFEEGIGRLSPAVRASFDRILQTRDYCTNSPVSFQDVALAHGISERRLRQIRKQGFDQIRAAGERHAH